MILYTDTSQLLFIYQWLLNLYGKNVRKQIITKYISAIGERKTHTALCGPIVDRARAIVVLYLLFLSPNFDTKMSNGICIFGVQTLTISEC